MEYNQLRELIPKDKFDIEPFPLLMKIDEDEVKPILPELLFCVADMNWPIATEMVKVLVRFPDSVVPIIKNILMPTQSDEEWKYFIITGLIPELPAYSQELLMGDIKRILDNPTKGELSGEVWDITKEYMERYEGLR